MSSEETSVEETLVEVFWRPGCGACRAMRVTLAEAGVAADWHKVWEDRDASALVRSVASGNETVPTLVIGGRAHVAPSPRRALEEISRAAPHLVLHTDRWPPLRIVQWVAIITILVASELVASSGHNRRAQQRAPPTTFGPRDSGCAPFTRAGAGVTCGTQSQWAAHPREPARGSTRT